MLEGGQIAEYGGQLKALAGLSSSAVGVRFLADGEQPEGASVLKGHRYCQALMRARRGESVLLDAVGIACPAPAAAFGLRPLPYGCRDATDLGPNEIVLGFAAAMLPAVVEHLACLARKAIPAARSKKAWTALQGA